METGYCPSCDGEIKFSNPPAEGATTVCPSCRDDLIVIGTSPIELDWLYEYDMEEDDY